MRFAFAVFAVAMLPMSQAFAAEEVASSSTVFHLLSNKCEAEAESGPEATPQSPPLNVDDPATPGCNKWEINFVVDGDLARSGNAYELPLLDINYGVGDNIQLKYEVPYTMVNADGTSQSAVSDSKVGIKYMFAENEAAKFELAVYPQLSFIGASSSAVTRGLTTPGNITTLPVLLAMKVGQTSWGDLTMTANAGYNISSKEDRTDFISAAVGLGTPLGNTTGLMAELSTEQAIKSLAEEARDAVLKADVGVMQTLGKRFLMFGSVGHSLYSSDSQGHTYVLGGLRVLAGGT